MPLVRDRQVVSAASSVKSVGARPRKRGRKAVRLLLVRRSDVPWRPHFSLETAQNAVLKLELGLALLAFSQRIRMALPSMDSTSYAPFMFS